MSRTCQSLSDQCHSDRNGDSQESHTARYVCLTYSSHYIDLLSRDLHSNGDDGNTAEMWEIRGNGNEICGNTTVMGMTFAGVTEEMVVNNHIVHS